MHKNNIMTVGNSGGPEKKLSRRKKRGENIMNKKVALLMITGTTLGLTACGTGTPMQDTSAEQASSTESVQEESEPLHEETAEDLTEEKSDYIEDTT